MKIKVLKKKIKILDIDHVQTQEIQVMQQEKDELSEQIIQLRNQVDTYKHENKRLEKEKK